ncbi:unnamed protein product [Bemisia tabaci]|uniref:Major facilitator superfamily (MFS) profile domain-containing protein n=1 Tax=Bemisia tabaci TaxID=7038 RepID=A0A9P0F877_BEMTA|nr:unnamed protein product [Bemisia tabaci]
MFSKFMPFKSKSMSMETGNDRAIKPLICVALLIVFLAGCILGRSEDPRDEDDPYNRLKNHHDPKTFGDILYEYIRDIVKVPVIATVFFCWVCGSFADEHGRVGAMQLFFMLSGIGFGFLVYAQEYDFSILGTFILGAALGCSIPAPIYIAELCPVAYRSFFLGLVPVALSLGMFTVDVIELRGAEDTAWKSLCCFSGIGFLLSLFLHEAPEWLVMRNRPDAAIESLKWLKETSVDVDVDLRKLQETSMAANQRSDTTLEMLTDKRVWKPFAMLLGLALFQHLCGFYILIFYAPYLVNQYRTNIYWFSSYTGTDFLLLVATSAALVFHANLPRRTVAGLSGIGSSAALLGLFLHAHLFVAPHDLLDPTPDKDMLVPVFFFTLYIFSAVMGIYTLPWILMFEVFPLRHRGILCGLSFSTLYLGLFAFESRLNNYLLTGMDLQSLLCFFGTCALGFALFARSCLVETHKKTFEEIERGFTKERIFLPIDEKM